MVIFGLPVFYLFSLPVNFLAFRFSIYSAFRIRPNGSVRFWTMFGAVFLFWQCCFFGISPFRLLAQPFNKPPKLISAHRSLCLWPTKKRENLNLYFMRARNKKNRSINRKDKTFPSHWLLIQKCWLMLR